MKRLNAAAEQTMLTLWQEVTGTRLAELYPKVGVPQLRLQSKIGIDVGMRAFLPHSPRRKN